VFQVYGLHNGDGEVRYVGKTVKKLYDRLAAHRNDAKRGVILRPLTKWMRKHGPENIRIVLLEEFDSREAMNAGERFWIAQYYDLGVNLCNVTLGGDGGGRLGSKRSKAELEKMSASMLAYWQSPAGMARRRINA
jgi:hypothetical protein